MASTIILSDNGASSGSAGLKQTAGNDGVLILQTTTSGGTATNAVYVDNTQNVGLGVTPSAWVSGDTALQIKAGSGSGSLWGRNNSLRVVGNTYYDGTNYKYIASDYASFFTVNPGSVGGFNWNVAASGTAGNNVTFTQAMTLDSSGNLGLAVTPSAWAGGFAAIDIRYGGIAVTSAGSANTEVTHNAFYNGTNWIAKYTGGYGTRYAAGDGGHAWYTSSTTTTGGSAISFTQAMTLDTSGNLLQGTTSVGTMSGNTVHRLANTGIIARTSSSLASGSALNIVVSSGGASFAGFLVVENVVLSNALIRTQTTYSVFGRGTTFTATSIASSNGSSGAASFTVTCPSTGVISVTNTSGSTTGVNMSFFGSEGF